MNKQALTAKLKKLSLKNGVKYNTLQTTYFFEALLHRISLSSFKDNFVFKGGFLLASIVGIEHRSTIDMDFLLRNEQMQLSRLEEILNHVVQIDLGDNVIYEIGEFTTIKANDEYGGYSFKITAKLENIRIPFWIDIATGDPITPYAYDYQYKTLLLDKDIKLLSYPLETIIAEKLQLSLVNRHLTAEVKIFMIFI